MTKFARIALVALLVLAFAIPAYAAVSYQSGHYVGTTSQKNSKGHHRKISFHANFDAQEITNIKFVSTGTCSDGGDSHGSQGSHGSHLSASVNDNGDFKLDTKSKNGATKLTLRGHIEGKKANGTFKVVSHFTKDGKSDPNGSVTCTSHKVTWKAKKVS